MLVALVEAGIVAAVVALALRAWIRHKRLRDVINKIPGYDGLPFLGDSLHLKSDTLGFFQQVYDMCSQHTDKGIAKLWMGPEPILWVFKAETVEAVFNSSKHTKKAFDSYWAFQPWLGEGLLISYGEKWQTRRRMLTPTFHFKILEQFMHVFNEQAAVLVSLLDKKVGGPAFDVQPNIYRCTLDIICETAMGVQVGAQVNAETNFVRAVCRENELIMERWKFPWLWPDLLYGLTSEGKEHKACIKELHGFTGKVIRDRKLELDSHANDGEVNHDGDSKAADGDVTSGIDFEIYAKSKRRRLAFLDLLLETSRTDPSLTLDGIQEEVDTFMFEGHDTTASGFVSMLYMLALHPDLQVRVQQEVDSVFGGSDRDATMDDVANLKYSECVVKETLRLFPPVPWFGRTTTEPCTIGGYSVPKGVNVAPIPMLLHRDPERFPDPEKFNPDRWTEDNAALRHPFGYVPFSAGNRNCIGQRFAMLEEKVVLSHIMRKFTVSTKNKREDLVPMAAIILRPSVPLLLEFTRR